jgi:AI-2 transport protein TqsA
MQIVMFAIVLGIAVSLALSLARLATVLPTYQPRLAMIVSEVTTALAQVGVGRDQVRAALSGLDFGAVAGLLTSLLLGLASTSSS